MSKASKLVTDAILGEDTVTIIVNGRAYYVSPPTIIKLVKAAKYLDSFEEGKTLAEVLCMLKNLDDACKALSVFIQGDESISDELSKGTLEEVVNGLQTAYSLISNFGEECGKDDSKTTTIGNDTLLGQIASFMDSLHLSYQEVVKEIPYRNLLLMAKDKQRVACGDVMYEVTEEEFGMNFKKG